VWEGDNACVRDGRPLASATTTTAGVAVAPAGLVQVLTTGASTTSGRTELSGTGLNRGVTSTANGTIADVQALGGAVRVAIGASQVSATATGAAGGASVSDQGDLGTVRVTAGGNTVTVTPGTSQTFSVLGVGAVTVRANTITRTVAPDGLSAEGSVVGVATLTVRVGPQVAPLANATVNLLPLSASARVPDGGIDCPTAAPVLTTPADGSSSTDTTHVLRHRRRGRSHQPDR
jgi:hypothetical protein